MSRENCLYVYSIYSLRCGRTLPVLYSVYTGYGYKISRCNRDFLQYCLFSWKKCS